MLDVQPSPPTFAGQFDFDLLDPVRGTACLKSAVGFNSDQKIIYWMASPAFDKIPGDARASVAAAALNAIDGLVNADTMVVTRVVTETKGTDEVCAYVYGRGIRLTKAHATAPSKPAAQSAPAEDENNED